MQTPQSAHLRMRTASQALRALTALSVAVLALSSPAQAGEKAMRVVKDPETGQLRAPTAAEATALDAADAAAKAAAAPQRKRALATTSAAATAPTPVQQDNGAVRVDLDESSAVYSVATRKADGSIELTCVTGEKNANALVNAKPGSSKAAKLHKEHNHAVK